MHFSKISAKDTSDLPFFVQEGHYLTLFYEIAFSIFFSTITLNFPNLSSAFTIMDQTINGLKDIRNFVYHR